jgi:hypothetical protein
MSKPWDLTSKHSLDSAAEWIRKGSGAIFVLVIRGEDMICAVDPTVRPQDITAMIDQVLPELGAQLVDERARKIEDARLKEISDKQKASARYVRDVKEGSHEV